LFSTVSYAREIIFSEKEAANTAIDKISAIHTAIEKARGFVIPTWAYRDVLFMLIYYSIASFELLEKPLSEDEKEDVYNIFYRVGLRMGIEDLPLNYKAWLSKREDHMMNDLMKSDYTIDLYKQYKKHLGNIRYMLLLQSQTLVVPPKVKNLLGLRSSSLISPTLTLYKLSRKLKLDGIIKSMILPSAYKAKIKTLDVS
jgi:hypothetical protein